MDRKEEIFRPALKDKKIPILTIDNKWYKLFSQAEMSKEIKRLEEELNELLQKQGKLNNEMKEYHKLKAKLMDEIVSLMPSEGKEPDKESLKILKDNKRLISECNQKIESHQDELLDLPREIEKVNFDLMLHTMDACYDVIKDNTREIEDIGEWINQIRIALKKNVIRKQEKELNNQLIYSYMHDIFGAEVIEIFDMTYNPEERKLKRSVPKNEIKTEDSEEKAEE